MYAACLMLDAATTPQAVGTDRVLGVESRFGLGFQLSYPLRPFAGPGVRGCVARSASRTRRAG